MRTTISLAATQSACDSCDGCSLSLNANAIRAKKTSENHMTTDLIVDQSEFTQYCEQIREARIVAFDTEFVSEHTHQPELGLLQFAAAGRSVAVDPYKVPDLSPWWKLMGDDDTTVIVHGGQAEIRFCLTLGELRPRQLVDVQLAEGFQSRSYPLGYGALVKRVIGKRIQGKETRTDWTKRPLTDHQIHYALEDVNYLSDVWTRQQKTLGKLGREEWAISECEKLIDAGVAELERPAWARLPGVNRLNNREFAVVCELANWRAAEAERTNRPARRILRDDLLVELGKRQPRSMKSLMATRDMNRSGYRKSADDFLACVQRALDIPDGELPKPPPKERGDRSLDEQILGQFLGLALSNRCSECNLSKQLVGTTSDLKQLVRWHLAGRDGEKPKLATGWRAEICGDLLTDVLEGRIALRISDPRSDHPLAFEDFNADTLEN